VTPRSQIQKLLDTDATAQDFLDAFVQDQAAAMATRVNNSGLKDQLEFLNSEGMDDETVLKELKEAIRG
jgi:hypothetical protein